MSPKVANSPDNRVAAGRQLLAHTPLAGGAQLLEKLLLLNRLEQLRKDASREAPHLSFFSALLSQLNVTYECRKEDLAHIPRTGPVVVVVNHPFGLVEGPVLGSLLQGLRPDFKFLANALLASMPELANYVLPVDP